MRKSGICLTVFYLLALQGCFDNSGNETRDNTDNSKSSVQMQQGKTEQSK